MRETESIAKSTRIYRRLHKWIAIPLLLFMFLSGTTGFLLGWKKQTGLLPKTEKGTSVVPSEWLDIAQLEQIAKDYAEKELQKSGTIDRIDIRPEKGVAKIIYSDHFSGVQIDCKTGEIISRGTRYSDLFEKIHDGSIVDVLFSFEKDSVKLIYTTSLSLGLILLSFSGFWMWLNPKRIRKLKRSAK